MADYTRLVKMNPALLARRLVAAEEGILRQLSLNEAAGARLVALKQQLAQQGAFIVALLEALGGRFELGPEKLRQIEEANLKVHYSYPDDKRSTFLMVLSAEPDRDERIEQIEAKLREQGVSEEQIKAMRESFEEMVNVSGFGVEPASQKENGPPGQPTEEP